MSLTSLTRLVAAGVCLAFLPYGIDAGDNPALANLTQHFTDAVAVSKLHGKTGLDYDGLAALQDIGKVETVFDATNENSATPFDLDEEYKGLLPKDWLKAINRRRCRFSGTYVVWDSNLARQSQENARAGTQENIEWDKRVRDYYDATNPEEVRGIEFRIRMETLSTAEEVLVEIFDEALSRIRLLPWRSVAIGLAPVLRNSRNWRAFLMIVWSGMARVGCGHARNFREGSYFYYCRFSHSDPTQRIPTAYTDSGDASLIDENFQDDQYSKTVNRATECSKAEQECTCDASVDAMQNVWDSILAQYRSSYSSETEAWTAIEQGQSNTPADGVEKFFEKIDYLGGNQITARGTNDASLIVQNLIWRKTDWQDDEPVAMTRQQFFNVFGRPQYLDGPSLESLFWKTTPADWLGPFNGFRCHFLRHFAAWNYGLALSVKRYVDARDFDISSSAETGAHPEGPAWEWKFKTDYPAPPAWVFYKLVVPEINALASLSSPTQVQNVKALMERYMRNNPGVAVSEYGVHYSAIQWKAIRQIGCASSFDGRYHSCRYWVGHRAEHSERVNNFDMEVYARNVKKPPSGGVSALQKCFDESLEGNRYHAAYMGWMVARFECLDDSWAEQAALTNDLTFNHHCRGVFPWASLQLNAELACDLMLSYVSGVNRVVNRVFWNGAFDDGLWEYPVTLPPGQDYVDASAQSVREGPGRVSGGVEGWWDDETEDHEGGTTSLHAPLALLFALILGSIALQRLQE